MRVLVVGAVAVVVLGLMWLLFGEMLTGTDDGYDGAGYEDDYDDEASRALLKGDEEAARRRAAEEAAAAKAAELPEGLVGPDELGGILVKGRVLDDRRRPVADAEVVARFKDRDKIATKTDANGEYQFYAGDAPETGWAMGLVRANAPGPLTGVSGMWLSQQSGEVVVVNPIILGTAHKLAVHVVHQEAPVPNADVVVTSTVWGQMTPVAEGKTNEAGVFEASLLPEGNVTALCAAKGYGRGQKMVTLPRTSKDVFKVELPEERIIELTVVDKETEEPIPGAKVSVQGNFGNINASGMLPPLEVEPTNEEGKTRVTGLTPKKTYRFVAEAQGYPKPNPWGGTPSNSVKADDTEGTIKLGKFRTVTFPIADNAKVDPPPDGTELRVELQFWMRNFASKEMKAYMKDGELVIEGLPDSWMNGRVVAENAEAAFWCQAGAEKGNPVSFAASRKVTIAIKEKGAGPVADARIRLQGSMAMQTMEPMTTDPEGKVEVDVQDGIQVQVYMLPPHQAWGGAMIGNFKIEEGKDLYEIDMEPEAPIVIRINIDGEDRLPPQFNVTIGGAWKNVNEITEDPDAGELRVAHRWSEQQIESEKPVPVIVNAQGYLQGKAEIVPGKGQAEQTVKVEMPAAGTVIVYVEKPSDGSYNLQLQKWNDETQKWDHSGGNSGFNPMSGNRAGGRADDGSQKFEGLKAGTYRARDATSRIESNSVEVTLGGPPSEIMLDLTTSVWIEGKVEVPEGESAQQTRILVQGQDDPANQWAGRRPDQKGNFKIRGVAGQEVMLMVRHPVLGVAGGNTNIAVVAGGGPITITMVAGSEIHFKHPDTPEPKDPSSTSGAIPVPSMPMPGGGGQVRVVVFEGGTLEKTVKSINPTLKGTTWRLGGLPPGKYTLWIEAYQKAPIIKKNVTVGEGVTDLGMLQQPVGATIRVRVATQSDTKPQTWVQVHHQGEPKYQRSMWLQMADGKDLVVKGLGAGRFKVTVRVFGQGFVNNQEPIYDEEVELDGTGETVIDVTAK